MNLNLLTEINQPNSNAKSTDFIPNQKVWLYQFGDNQRIFPAIIASIIDEGHILVWKYALGLWLQKVAMPSHLAPRTTDISSDIYERRKENV